MTKLKVPSGTSAISFGKNIWKAVDGFIDVAEEFIEHLISHAACSAPTAEELAALKPSKAAKVAKGADDGDKKGDEGGKGA